MLDTSDTQVYMFVFCFWKGKNTGRAVIAIKEQLCPQMSPDTYVPESGLTLYTGSL